MSELLERFIRYSELVGNINEITDRATFMETLDANEYEFVKLSFDESANRETDVGEMGIKKALVEAQYGIAETGTVILEGGNENYRRATSLCDELHVVVGASKIVEKLEDVAEYLKNLFSKDGSSYAVFVTGASRTADIEMSLSLGVHGPESMKVTILTDL